MLPPKKKRRSDPKTEEKVQPTVLHLRPFDKKSFGELGDEIWKLFSDIGWLPLLNCREVVFPDLVRQFYANLQGDENLITSSVLGVTIQIDDEAWSEYLGVSTSSVKVQTGPWKSTYRFDKVKALTTFFGRDMPHKKCQTLTRHNLKLPLHTMLHYIITTNLNTRRGGSMSRITLQDVVIMQSLLIKQKLNLGAFCLGRMLYQKDRHSYLYANVLSRVFVDKLDAGVLAYCESYQVDDPITSASLLRMGFMRLDGSWKRSLEKEKEEFFEPSVSVSAEPPAKTSSVSAEDLAAQLKPALLNDLLPELKKIQEAIGISQQEEAETSFRFQLSTLSQIKGIIETNRDSLISSNETLHKLSGALAPMTKQQQSLVESIQKKGEGVNDHLAELIQNQITMEGTLNVLKDQNRLTHQQLSRALEKVDNVHKAIKEQTDSPTVDIQTNSSMKACNKIANSITANFRVSEKLQNDIIKDQKDMIQEQKTMMASVKAIADMSKQTHVNLYRTESIIRDTRDIMDTVQQAQRGFNRVVDVIRWKLVTLSWLDTTAVTNMDMDAAIREVVESDTTVAEMLYQITATTVGAAVAKKLANIQEIRGREARERQDK